MDNELVTKQPEKPGRIPPKEPAWNIWQVLFLILVVSLIEIPLGWLNVSDGLDTMSGSLRFLTVGFGDAGLYLLLIFLALRLIRRPFSDLGFVRPRARYVGLGVVMGIVLFAGISILGNFIARYLGQPAPQSFAQAITGSQYSWQFVLLLLLGGVIAPLKEEAVFRGMVYPPLLQEYGKGKAMLLTGLFFALLHFDMVRFIPLFLGGVLLAWIYEKTASIWPSIIAHGTWNVLMAIALWMQR